MNQSERDALQRLCDAATPGPWRHRTDSGNGVTAERVTYIATDQWNLGAEHFVVGSVEGSPDWGNKNRQNAAFIAASRTAIPALLAALTTAEHIAAERGQELVATYQRLSAERDDLQARLTAAERERDELLIVARQCPSCEFTYSHTSLLPLQEAESERDSLRAQLARYEAVVQASVAMRQADRDVPAGESIAELEVTSRGAVARTNRALVLWRTAVDALPGPDAGEVAK